MENPHAAHETPHYLTRMECGVQCLAGHTLFGGGEKH
jgi:hypothetical protein